MKYLIHQKSLIGSKAVQDSFESEVGRCTKSINKILSDYSKSPQLELFISKVNPKLLRVSISIKLKGKLLYFEAKGEKPLDLLKPLCKKLKEGVRKYLVTERREHLIKRKQKRAKAFTEHTKTLEQLHSENEKEQFSYLIRQLSPSLKQYALRYLSLHGEDKKITLSNQEIMAEIYLNIFEKFKERPENTAQFSAWSYKISRETLQMILEKHTYRNENQIDIDMIAEKEMESMLESYTADADGDLIMFEELDDISYRNTSYSPEILPDEHLMTYLEESHETETNFHDQVSKILHSTNSFEKHIFELYWLDEMTETEISEATGTGIDKVKNIIESITQKIISQLKGQNII